MIGQTYLERGEPVMVLAQWSRPLAAEGGVAVEWLRRPGSAPRNVLIQRDDRTWEVRPFHGLRKEPGVSLKATKATRSTSTTTRGRTRSGTRGAVGGSGA